MSNEAPSTTPIFKSNQTFTVTPQQHLSMSSCAEQVLGQWQIRMASIVTAGHDAVVIAGCGSGKSAVIQLLGDTSGSLVLVISPLTGLIKQQVQDMNNCGLESFALTGEALQANPSLWPDLEKAGEKIRFILPHRR
jgi:superfamily II DNA helicase RecQ